MNRDVFFREVRASLFRGKIKQSQVDGLNDLLDVWEKNYSEYPEEYLAYCLATAFHETARTMQPIKEYGRGRGRKYGRADAKTGQTYYGRGYVQLTWKYNYKKAGEKLGCDFVNKPNEVMRPDWAARILYTGCIEGWFTGRSLENYITPQKSDYRQARRIVNGMDKASTIAGYAKKFEHAIEEAMSDEPVITERQLENAGSRTIKHAKGGKDAGGAIVGIGVIGMLSKILERLKDFSASLGEWASSLSVISDALSSITSLWPYGLVVAGGLAFWRYTQIIKARIDDEPKIGRLENAANPD